MPLQKKPLKNSQIKAQLRKEIDFLKNIFSLLSMPQQMKGDNDNTDYEMVADSTQQPEKELSKRAVSITELEEKLAKLKSKNKFSLKRKLEKKSLTSKLNKKLKKGERLNKVKIKRPKDTAAKQNGDVKTKPNVNVAKPVYNSDGKLVFSKFDFANVGKKDKPSKTEKDPKKILENLERQKEKLRQLEETQDGSKVKEIKEKLAWKTVLQKAEGQKIKDDPILLKKSIKKMEQKKKHSEKQWENRIQSVEQKKEERQKKRKENIAKKKKEKKTKIVKSSIKRGRVVIK